MTMRWFAAVLLAMVVALPAPPARAQTASTTLQLATVLPESDISSRALKRFGETIEQKTGGRVKFRYHWAGSLVGNKTFDAVHDGTVDAALQFSSYVSGQVPDVAILEVPFTFPVDEKPMVEFHREVEPIVRDIYAGHKNHVIGSLPILMADPISCRSKFLASPADWKGTLVRTAGRWQAETVKLWGGSPVVFALGDLYAGLQRGTVDCTLLVYNLLEPFKLHEVATYITRIDHSVNYGTIDLNADVWKKLSPADQKIFTDAAQDVLTWSARELKAQEETVLKRLAERGAKFCTPSAAEFQRLVAASDRVWDAIGELVTPKGKQLMEVAAKYRRQVVAGPKVGDTTPCK